MKTQNVDDLFHQAREAAQNKRLQDAAVLLEQILEKKPNHLQSHDLMGYVQYFLNSPKIAITHCDRALELKPGHTYALKGKGLCLAKLGKTEEGIVFLHKSIQSNPTYFDARWDLAVVLHQAGRNDEALAIVNEALPLFPKHRPRLEKLKQKLMS